MENGLSQQAMTWYKLPLTSETTGAPVVLLLWHSQVEPVLKPTCTWTSPPYSDRFATFEYGLYRQVKSVLPNTDVALAWTF